MQLDREDEEEYNLVVIATDLDPSEPREASVDVMITGELTVSSQVAMELEPTSTY